MTLEEVREIRSVIDYYPQYKIIEDIHLENNEILMKVSITISECSEFVPNVSEWYIVFSSLKDIDFYPAKENSVSVTFPHQAYNTDLEQCNFRSGKPCLDVPEHVLNLQASYFPYKSESRFSWYLERMLNWLRCAATNSLFKVGDPYEVPTNLYFGDKIIYKEANIEDWSNFNYKTGYATLQRWKNDNTGFYVLDKFYDKSEVDCREANWGDISKQFKATNKKAIWVICNEFPIKKPWQYPITWEELLKICNNQNIKLLDIVCSLLWKGSNYRRNDFYLLLGGPIPEKHGEEFKSYYWIMCNIPPLCFPRNGFRKSKDGFKSYLKGALRGEISWSKTNNWDDSIIRTRGIVQKELRKSTYAVIGVGALGGFVCELLSRQGIQNIKIIDGDTLQVGNLSRHILTLSDLGKNKAKAMADRLAQNSPSTRVVAKDKYLDNDNIAFLDDCDVIIDCTAEDEVVELLSQYEFKADKHFYIGAFTYGAKGFLFYKQFAKTIDSDLFFKRTKEFYDKYVQDVKEENLIMEGIGCYHPVFPAMDSDVNLWSSIFVKEIVKDLENPKACAIKAFEQAENGAIEISIDEAF
ncbi:MAG: ThiF family adenylyltransferase [Muribaculaceae bacterium]|nr:ThiF family adenylyltransferase [Muribaculaceae bacterium]MCM1439440.1 ThiF family adenylyltransferase [Roseburia sp.]